MKFFILLLLRIIKEVHRHTHTHMGFPGGKVAKNPPANAGDSGDEGSITGLRRSP